MTESTLVYFHTYRTNVKERWKNKSLVDILEYEFRTRTREYFIEAIESVDYIKHIVHMHEPQVPKIHVIAHEEEYWVIHKPAGVPCHPTGGYREYSVTRKLFGDKKVACVNRLDMPVSGVLIITFENFKNNMMKISEAEKIYVAKVEGEFPDYVDCQERIFCEEGRRRFVSERGKECQTLFKKIEYKNGYSLVECKPITGRTHQIRIHLQSLGFSIVNDYIYGNYTKEENTFKKDCTSKCEEDPVYNCVLRNCKGENNRGFELRDKHICLHAYAYKFNNVWYKADWPEWTKL
ncbi:ribosomal large subunit pseudouridine synthase [Vairimorpha necatrix]|uniref:Ribosomal large subunit pseudouridine synthase n=1 Tax=Vairimorpha necatrix TaxID=6039 RepID=A0AAX4JC05_9MICR